MRLLELLRPFRLVIARRVSEEEQITVEAFCRTEGQAAVRAEGFLRILRDHKRAYNAEVVEASRRHLETIDVAIAAKQAALAELDARIEQAHADATRADDLRRKKVGNVLSHQELAELRSIGARAVAPTTGDIARMALDPATRAASSV